MQEYEKRVLRKASKEHVRRIIRCSECYSPLLLKWLFRWHDGVITLRLLNPDFRFAFLENDMLRSVMDFLVEQFGEERVFEIARSTERGSATGYLSMVLAAEQWWMKPISYLIRYSFILDYLLELNVSFLGYGAADMVDKELPNGVVFMRHPYVRSLFQADVEAAYMLARDREITIRTDPVSEAEGIYMYAGKAESERTPGAFREYRLETPPVTRVTDPYTFLRCPRCGVPGKISQFWWDARSGIIAHKETGKRIILWPCYALERLLGALEEQLGGTAGELIFQTVKDYERDSILSGGVGFTPEEKLAFIEADRFGQYRLLLHHLACMGFGDGKLDLAEDDVIRISMANSLVPQVTSGQIAGMVEALEGRPVTVSWELGPKATSYTLKLL